MNGTAVVIAAGIGTLAGLHTATWGMYKDSIHEGFFWPRYFRSPIVGFVMALIAYAIARPALNTAGYSSRPKTNAAGFRRATAICFRGLAIGVAATDRASAWDSRSLGKR